MLKDKKSLYILIPVNILIWGFFVTKIFPIAVDQEPTVQAKQKMADLKPLAADSTAYTLKLNYPDPFLKNVERFKRAAPSTSIATLKTPKPEKPAPPPAPEIRYMGLVKNNKSGLVKALVAINGQTHLIARNEVLEGVTVKSFSRDTLIMKWGTERIVVVK